MKNIITLGKLIRLLSSLPLLVLLSINVHTKNTRNELPRLVMGTIFLVLHTYLSDQHSVCACVCVCVHMLEAIP